MVPTWAALRCGLLTLLLLSVIYTINIFDQTMFENIPARRPCHPAARSFNTRAQRIPPQSTALNSSEARKGNPRITSGLKRMQIGCPSAILSSNLFQGGTNRVF